ncbi:hypothetical protein ACWEPC_10205, partial [Nonomuraea sp. NPDC004297]
CRRGAHRIRGEGDPAPPRPAPPRAVRERSAAACAARVGQVLAVPEVPAADQFVFCVMDRPRPGGGSWCSAGAAVLVR